MKTVHSVIFLPVLIIILLVTPVFGSWDWVEYETCGNGNVKSYDKVNIKHRTKNIVQVWERTDFSDVGRQEHILLRRNHRRSTNGYENLSHRLVLNEIDCKKGMSNYLSMIFYNNDGGVLDSISFDKSDWDYIVPGSIEDTLREKVCNTSKTTLKRK